MNDQSASAVYNMTNGNNVVAQQAQRMDMQHVSRDVSTEEALHRMQTIPFLYQSAQQQHSTYMIDIYCYFLRKLV